MVHGAGFRRRTADQGRRDRDEEASLLSRLRPQNRRRDDRACRKADLNRAGSHVQGVVCQFGIGGQRSRDQVDLVLQQRARAAGKEEDHLPQQGLSRDHRRHRQPDGAGSDPQGFRSAHRPVPAYGLPPLLPERRRRRVGGGIRHPVRGKPGKTDSRRRPGHDRRVFRRTGHGRGRGHRAAGNLFPEGPGRSQAIRRAVPCRRGHLRLRPDRQHVGFSDLRS